MQVGVLGCGAIGRLIIDAIAAGRAGDAVLAAVADLPEREADLAAIARATGCRYTTDPRQLPALGAALVVEAAGVAAVRMHAVPLLATADLLMMSVGAMADAGFSADVVAAARSAGRRVYLPSGAIAGLDGVRAAAGARLDAVVLTTRKPPAGLKGAPYFNEHPVDLDALPGPTVVFEGSAAEAIAAFPANVNVAVTLSLAGLGPEATRVRVVAEPGLTRNIHEISVRGEFGELTIQAANVPSPDNPRTSYLAALSALAALRRITSPLQVGA